MKMTGLTAVTTLAFNVLFTITHAGGRIARRRVFQASFGLAFAALAPESIEIPVVGLTLIALIAGHAVFTLTFAVR